MAIGRIDPQPTHGNEFIVSGAAPIFSSNYLRQRGGVILRFTKIAVAVIECNNAIWHQIIYLIVERYREVYLG